MCLALVRLRALSEGTAKQTSRLNAADSYHEGAPKVMITVKT